MNIKSVTNAKSVSNTSNSKVNNNSKSSFKSFLGESKDLDAIFQKAADKYGVDVKLLKAIGKAESDFNPNCTSHCGAMGIMQLMPGTAKGLGVKNAYDPEQCIMGGAKLISGLIKKYDGNVTLALAGYNAGTGNVRKYGGVPPFKETQNYIKKVMKYSGSTGNVKVNEYATSKPSTTPTTSAEASKENSTTSQTVNQNVPVAGTRMIPSGYQMKRAATESANTAVASEKKGTPVESVVTSSDAVNIMKSIATNNSDQLTAYLNSLKEKGEVKDVNDMFSYDDYLKFMNIFFKEDDKKTTNTTNSAATQIQMSASISSMLKNL